MGSPSMTNWKLGAFFIVSLMLFAAVFSTTAMAAPDDGEGIVKVGWANADRSNVVRNLATDGFTRLNGDTGTGDDVFKIQVDSNTTTSTDDGTGADQSGSHSPLAAGSSRNVLRFTYTAINNVAGTANDSTADDDPTVADNNDTAINMSGGRLRIAFPSGWKVSNKLIRVYDGLGTDRAIGGDTGAADTIIYETNIKGEVIKTIGTATSQGRVTFSADNHITITLDAKWSPAERGTAALVGRQLVIVLGDVQTGVPRSLSEVDDKGDGDADNDSPYFNYTFPASSSAKNGTLVLLDAGSPAVRVGNIIGDNTTAGSDNILGTDDDSTYTGRDTLERKVVITPKHVFVGEKEHKYTISFTAPGPMYNASLSITIPTGLQPSEASDEAKNAGLTLKPSGVADFNNTSSQQSSGRTTVSVITLPEIDVGQTVSVTYELATIGGDGNNDFGLVTIDPAGSVGPKGVTKLEGGKVSPVAGSGSVALSPNAAEASSQRRTITVTYTAHTDLTGYDVAITPDGLVIDTITTGSTQKLQSTSSTGYGYVTGSMSDNLSITGSGAGIKWTNITLKKNNTLTAKIQRVNISATPDEYTWATTVNTTGTAGGPVAENPAIDGDDVAYFSVVKTSGDAVSFTIVDQKDEYPALSEATITFRFTATGTTIRDGSVSLTIPAALGSAPTITKKVNGRVMADSTSGTLAKDQKKKPGVSGRTVTVDVKRLDADGTVDIIYGSADDDGKKAIISDVSGDVKVTGTFKTSSSGGNRTAGTVTLTVGNVEDGVAGTTATTRANAATLSPGSIEAGSVHRAIEVVFTAAGTMDGGAVSLEVPKDWGDMQNDPTKRNYLTTRGSAVESVEVGTRSAVATIGKLAKGGSFRFVLGGGTGGANNGVEVQDTVGTAKFVIKSDGDGDGVFAPVVTTLEWKDREKVRNPDKTGKIYKDAAGVLQIKVTSALDGTGSAVVDVTSVRAADDDVKLVFTYTPSQTIEGGELKLTVPSSWSKPQVEEVGMPGYTEVEGVGLDSITDDDKFSVTVPIFGLDKTNTIKITYGASETGRAVASPVVGTASFRIQMKGHADGTLANISTQPTVTVQAQASGKGTASVVGDGDALHAGDTDRKFTTTYTAAGQMVAGKVRLTVPAGWTAPTAANVTVTPAMTLTADAQTVAIEGVNLLAGGMVTFVYTGDVLPKADEEPGAVSFAVASHGGLTTDTYADVAAAKDKTLSVDVGHSRAGSGKGAVSPRIVQAGDKGVNITFTYTAAGWTDAPREFRVQVPAGWTAPTNASSAAENKGTYTVVHRNSGVETMTSVEKLDPIGRDMVARVKQGGLEVEAGDEIIFTYENADAPATAQVSAFKLLFDGKPVDANVSIRVQDSTASQVSLSSAGTVSADEGAMPLALTVGLADSTGKAVAMASDTTVTLTSSSAGTFAMTADGTGTESLAVTIAGGDVSTMAYYMDSTAGTATITASAPGLTSASHSVTVTTSVIEITAGSVMVSPALAMAGDTVTVSAMGTAGQTTTFSVGTIVTDKAMMESAAAGGSYSGSFMVVADQHADGTYDVTVSLAGQTETATGALTLDSTMPTVTASASPATVANGDTVMISATATDASAISSVMADVSALDSTQSSVALTMGTDGSYSASVTISADNEAMNGSKTITVTAMDAAGNSGMGTAMVTLDNKLTYTSTISAGTSLFHVPLDVEGLDTVGDLKTMLGSSANLLIIYDSATGTWNSRSDAVAITADLGIIVSASAAITATFTGDPWDGGTSTLSLAAGSNLVGLPINDPRVTNVSDISSLFAAGVVTSIVVSTDTGFAAATAANDGPVSGDAAYLITATADATAALVGTGWSNDATASAPVGLVSYQVEGQTPVLDLSGTVVDEITGAVQDGFRVKVKNLSTKASLSKVTSTETAEGYNMTFVDLKDAHAARVGDILEISADSPNPLMGVQPVRHTVTVEDVKAHRIELENLIAYEIPAETELLRNYPNPFNPETWIPYRLAEDADVSLTIYDVNGELVRTIDIGYQNAAVYESRSKAIYWDGRNRLGEQVASGVYFYSLSAGDFSGTRKMVILK